MDNMQCSTEHCRMHNDMDDEYRINVQQKPPVGVLCTDSKTCLSWMNTCILIIVCVMVIQHNAYNRNFQKCHFWWTSLVCFRLSISVISYTISTHKVLNQRVRFLHKMYISDLFKAIGYFHMADFKNCWETYCAKCIYDPTPWNEPDVVHSNKIEILSTMKFRQV